MVVTRGTAILRGIGLVPALIILGLSVAAIVGRNDEHPDAELQVSWWVLALAFALAERHGAGSPAERRLLTDPVARIPLVVGLYLAGPWALVWAQVLGAAAGGHRELRADPVAASRRLVAIAIATAVGSRAYLLMTDVTAPHGPAGWLDGAVAGGAVVVTSLVLAAGETMPPPRTWRAVGRWARIPVLADCLGVATGLVVVEVVRVDPHGAWLLVLPAVAALLVRHQYESADARARSLVDIRDAVVAIQDAPSLDHALLGAASRIRRMTGSVESRVVIELAPDRFLAVTDDGRRRMVRAVSAAAGDMSGWRLLRASGGAQIRASHRLDARPTERWSSPFARRRRVVTSTVALADAGCLIGFVTVTAPSGYLTQARAGHRLLATVAAGVGPALGVARRLGSLRDEQARCDLVLERLGRANRELRRVSAAKSTSLATTSHELRAPLTALLAEAAALERTVGRADGVELSRQLVADVDANSRHLLRLVDDLLDITRIETGQLALRSDEVRLDEVAAEVVAALRPVVEADGITLHLDADPGCLEGDAVRLWQIIANLVDNARRATPAGGSIVVRVAVDGEIVVCEVEDTGCGIPADDLERIFEAFERGAGAASGLGLGLALARHLAERHAGRLTVTSELGRGSCFRAVFPAAPALRAGAPPTFGVAVTA